MEIDADLPALEPFDAYLPPGEPDHSPRISQISATPFRWVDPRSIPQRAWIYGRHYIRRFISTTCAPGGIGKSSLGIVEALAIVTGRPLLDVAPDEVTNVWLWNGEDPMEELQRRIIAAARHFDITSSELDGRLFVDTGRQMKICIAEQTKSGVVIARPIVDAVIAAIRDNEIGLFSVDPFVASHRVTENDNGAIEAVAATWAEIADATGAAIELVHHVRKTGGGEVTVDDMRGAGALLAKARSARVLNGMTEDEAAKYAAEHRRTYFRVANGKANLALPPDKAEWYRLVSCHLGNGRDQFDPGDSVGVVTAWKLPDPLASVSVADLQAVQKAIAASRWRENSQAADWAGKAVADVLRLDIGNKADKAKIAGLLKIWLASKALVIVEGEDGKRMKRSYIEVGTWAND